MLPLFVVNILQKDEKRFVVDQMLKKLVKQRTKYVLMLELHKLKNLKNKEWRIDIYRWHERMKNRHLPMTWKIWMTL